MICDELLDFRTVAKTDSGQLNKIVSKMDLGGRFDGTLADTFSSAKMLLNRNPVNLLLCLLLAPESLPAACRVCV